MTIAHAVRNPDLRRLWLGVGAMALSNELFRIAFLWLAAAHGEGAAPLASALQGAVMLTAVLAGVAVGGGGRQLLVFFAGLEAAAILSLVLPLGPGGPPLALVLAAVAVVTLASAQMEPNVQAALPRLARTQADLLGANGLVDGTRRIARLVGPGCAGMALVVMPVLGLVPAASALALGGAIVFLGLPPLKPSEDRGPALRQLARFRPLADAARVIASRPELRLQAAVSIVMNVVWTAGPILGWTLMLEARFGPVEGARHYSQMVTAYAVSNIAVNLWAASRPSLPSLPAVFAAYGVYGAGLLAIGVLFDAGAPAWSLLPVAAVAGAGPPLADLRLFQSLQTGLPPALVGPGFRIRLAWAWSAALAGSALAGAVVPFASPALLVAAMGVLALATAILAAIGARRLAAAPLAAADTPRLSAV